MILISASLAKLCLFDLATLDGSARVVAFLRVDLVLLAAGVRYARLIDTVQSVDKPLTPMVNRSAPRSDRSGVFAGRRKWVTGFA